MDNIQTAPSLERDLAERDDGPPDRLSLWLVNALALAGTILFLVYNVHILLPRIFDAMALHSQWRYLFYPSLLWLIMGSVLFAFRTVIWMRYRPISPVTPDMAPTVSVIIPAYNEGSMVLRSIQSVAEARFPHDRLEILVVDDGSADDTWAHICTAAARYPDLVTPLRHDSNRGKRAALAWGFERARGEFIVSIDSDSVIDRDALLALVAPFCDSRVGAVAGKVLVYNRRGLIPQMLHARYIMSFDFLRAVESAYRNVFCCPGALTALRASAIRPLVTRWQAQTFLGSPCTIGEDRAMTNY
ncbi:MAG: glycosyltransferase family 2 protein, partial [Alphaproteobacteria bacterium]|nr:glycosyltransferase family 2 protein [Alphaproteobacteria bacterium]